jgi:hypothetical protein
MSSLYCVLGLMYVFGLFEARVLLYLSHCNTGPAVEVYTTSQFWDSNLKYKEYTKHKIRRPHLFADLAIDHLWSRPIPLVRLSLSATLYCGGDELRMRGLKMRTASITIYSCPAGTIKSGYKNG